MLGAGLKGRRARAERELGRTCAQRLRATDRRHVGLRAGACAAPACPVAVVCRHGAREADLRRAHPKADDLVRVVRGGDAEGREQVLLALGGRARGPAAQHGVSGQFKIRSDGQSSSFCMDS